MPAPARPTRNLPFIIIPSFSRSVEAEQPRGVAPEDGFTLIGGGKAMAQPDCLIVVIDGLGRGKERPVRSPDATLDTEIADKQVNDASEVLMGKGCVG